MTARVDHERTLTRALEALLERGGGDAPCLDGGDERWTTAELVELTRRLAGGLRQAGVGPGDRVAIYRVASPSSSSWRSRPPDSARSISP